MVTKNEVKYIQSLYHKKNRSETGLFIAEGPKLIHELLQSNFVIQKIFATSEWLAENKNVLNTTEITTQQLEQISNLSSANKVIAIAEQKKNDAIIFKNKLVLALDGIRDPGNMGTIIRTAHWFGIDTIIASNDTVDLYNPKVVQATMGSIAKVDVICCDLKTVLENAGVKIYGATLQGKDIKEYKKINEGILVVGNEGNGIRENIFQLINETITIKGNADTESLNVAVATGIILSHVV